VDVFLLRTIIASIMGITLKVIYVRVEFRFRICFVGDVTLYWYGVQDGISIINFNMIG